MTEELEQMRAVVASLGPVLADMTETEAQRRVDAARRIIFAHTYIEPHLQEITGDATARELLPNHEFVLGSPAKYQETVKSRKIAHSFGLAAFALSEAACKDGSTTIIASYDEDEAREKNAFLENIYRELDPSLQKILKMSDGQEVRKFANRSRIRFIARKAPTGAGANILIDEFSVERKGGATPVEMLIAAIGATTHTGCIRLGGTQRGEYTLFNMIASGRFGADLEEGPLRELMKNISWEVKQFPWWESPALCNNVPLATVVAPGMDTIERVEKFGNQRLKEQFIGYMTTPDAGLEMFQREFECTILDDTESYYPLELIQGVTAVGDYWFREASADGTKYESDRTTLDKAKKVLRDLRFAIGRRELDGDWAWAMDIGRSNDQDEIWIGHEPRGSKDVLALRLCIGMHKMPFDGKREILDTMFVTIPQLSRGYLDATSGGMGIDLYEWCRKKWGYKVMPFEFNIETKRALATGFKIRMEQSKIILPPFAKFRRLQQQLLKVKKMETKAHNILYDVERNKNFHGDNYWSAAMLSDLFGHPRMWMPRRAAVAQQVGYTESNNLSEWTR